MKFSLPKNCKECAKLISHGKPVCDSCEKLMSQFLDNLSGKQFDDLLVNLYGAKR